MADTPYSTLRRGFICRLYPNSQQSGLLSQWIGSQRFIYNCKVRQDRLNSAYYQQCTDLGLSEIQTELNQEYSLFKDKQHTHWLYTVPSQVLRNGAVRWFTAKQRQLKGLAKAPKSRNRDNFYSVHLTKELFELSFKESVSDTEHHYTLNIGTSKYPVGTFIIITDRLLNSLPNELTVKVKAGKWSVSFSTEQLTTTILRTPEELLYELKGLSEPELKAVSLGLDRNVKANFFSDSKGQFYGKDSLIEQRLLRKDSQRRKYQRKMARSPLKSHNRRKLKQRLAKNHHYCANVRMNLAHHISRVIVNQGYRLIVLEDLKIQNMTKRPKAKFDPITGKWLKNGRKAKSALTSKILNAVWGRTTQYLQYKGLAENQLVIKVHPAYTSQECNQCHHTDPLNRKGETFHCLNCHHTQHADHNSPLNIQLKGIQWVLSDEASFKEKKHVTFKKKKDSLRAGKSDPEKEMLEHPVGRGV